ncbi:MAG: tartrate dehydrogenase, partial [Chloroflexi bacterium]|nr:tartrate dehydrogenase [Chloroflexota bacterium]
LLEHVGEAGAARAVDAALREGFRSGRIEGLEAGSGRTMDVAEAVVGSVREGAH